MSSWRRPSALKQERDLEGEASLSDRKQKWNPMIAFLEEECDDVEDELIVETSWTKLQGEANKPAAGAALAVQHPSDAVPANEETGSDSSSHCNHPASLHSLYMQQLSTRRGNEAEDARADCL